jgi:hypothetical protein
MKTYTYVDNSNVFIEGRRAAAVVNGLAIDIRDAIRRRIFDNSYQIDYGKLHEFICGDKNEIAVAKLWGSPPPSDSFWNMVESKGFKVKTYERSYGKEKKVDTAMAYEIGKDLRNIDKSDAEITIVAGDKDYVPIIEDLANDGYNLCVAFWDHAAEEVKALTPKFLSLNKWMDHLRFKPN